MARAYWLIKSEPAVYAFATLEKAGHASWDGIRNFEARNNLRAMKVGDLCLYYHTGGVKEIVGVAKVTKTAYPDPTADEGDWSAVDVAPAFALAKVVSLATVKATKSLATMALVKKSRISVTPVTPDEYATILELSGTRPSARRGA